MAYHVLSWFFGNGEPTPLVLYCKHTLTQWILTDELEKAHSACLTQVPARSGFIPITFLNQTKVDSFDLIPPHFNNDMDAYSGHLKTELNSQKVTTLPVWARVFLPKNMTLWEASKACALHQKLALW